MGRVLNHLYQSFSKLQTLAKAFATKCTPIGAVVTNAPKCAEIGAAVLNKGGSAVDAAIASMLCEGIVTPSTMGLGGGFFMMIYNKEKRIVETLDSRAIAPEGATEDMFCGDSQLATRGGLAVGVPGELKGYWEAYQKYGGKVPWKDLIQPAIDLCKNGVPVTEFEARVYLMEIDLLSQDELMRETFIDPSTCKPYRAGQCIKRLKLAKTLEQIAKRGAEALSSGSLAENLAKDIQDKGGIITAYDLNCYKPEWWEPIKIHLPCDETMYTSPLPGSGAIISFILNVLRDFLDLSQPSSVTNYHKIIESFKYGFGRRTELGDPNFGDFSHLLLDVTSPIYADEIRQHINLDSTCQDPSHYGANVVHPGHGTSNICVLAPNGDAVAATSSINLEFGAGFMSESTGIILNNTMNNFSSPSIISSYHMPPSTVNFIKPGKRPLSSMCPSIILDKNGNVEMIIGAAGGPKIITSIILTIIKHLWFNANIQEAVSGKRLHHQLFPMMIEFEEAYKNDMDFVEALHKLGHDYKFTPSNGFNAVTAISRKDGFLDGAFDPRRGGERYFVF